jgi:hypothetical protein
MNDMSWSDEDADDYYDKSNELKFCAAQGGCLEAIEEDLVERAESCSCKCDEVGLREELVEALILKGSIVALRLLGQSYQNGRSYSCRWGACVYNVAPLKADKRFAYLCAKAAADLGDRPSCTDGEPHPPRARATRPSASQPQYLLRPRARRR